MVATAAPRIRTRFVRRARRKRAGGVDIGGGWGIVTWLYSHTRKLGFAAALLSLLAFVILLWTLYLTQLHRLLPKSGTLGWWESASHCLMVASGLAIGIGALTAPLSLSGRPWLGRSARAGASLLGSALLVGAYIDGRLYEVLGVHLYDSSVTTLLGRGSVNESLHVTGREVALVSGCMVGGALILLFAGWAGTRLFRRIAERSWLVLVFLCCLFIVGWGGSRRIHTSLPGVPTGALPFHGLLFAPRVSNVAGESWTIHYPRFDGPLPTLQRRPSLLSILIETLRGDMLTPEFMPELWALQSTPQCARSANHQASSHSTDHCLFSLLYGLHSYHYQVLGRRNVPDFPLRVLKQNGYRVVGGSSAALSQWGELSYLTEQFHEFFEAKGASPVERDRDLLRWSMDFLTTHSEGEPFFLVVFFDSTHHKYYYPPEFDIYKPALAESHSLISGDEQDMDIRNQLVNRYKNSVRFVDGNVGTLLRKFIQLRDGKDWIAAVTGDHGEEFWDHGLLGHASVSFVNARARVPLVLCTSDKVPLSLALTSHVDIMPTFLDYAGVVPAIDASDFSSGVSLLRARDPERMVLVSAMDFPEKNRQMAVVSQTSKFLVWKDPFGSRAFRVTSTTDGEDVRTERSDADREKALEFLNQTYRRFFVRSR